MSKWLKSFRQAWQGVSPPPVALVVAFTLICLAGGTMVRWGVAQIRSDSPFSLYLPAVVFVTVFGGKRAGIATTAGGGLLGIALTFPGTPTGGASVALFAIYMLIAVMILWGIEHYRSLVAHHREISNRLMEEERYRRLVVDELQHRLRNKVSTVHAVIRQVLHDQPDAWARIDGRIRALSSTDDLIARADESGCDVKDLLLSELGPYGHVRFTLNGNALHLPAKLAVCLALVFHELATNAAKYGAFASSKGVLTVSWFINRDELSIVWDEAGGPQVTPANKTGFGTRLLKSALTGFHGSTEMLFLPSGFRCAIRCRVPK